MAKRKRLTPTVLTAPGEESTTASPLRAPIAQVAGEAAAQSALTEVAAQLQQAREEGRLVQKIPLAQVELNHLIRDRVSVEEDALEDLVRSIDARGQQTPIEVVQLENGRYGLISGWRRMQALRRLGIDHVLAIVRTPETLTEAYVAMVEENEIRQGLSYYERARIAARACEQGLFETPQAAITALFAAGSRAKRSKINSFVILYQTLGEQLRYPTAIRERLGLALVAGLQKDAGLQQRLTEALRAPCETAAEEIAVLTDTLQGKEQAKDQPPCPQPFKEVVVPGITMTIYESGARGAKVMIAGKRVDADLVERLRAMLTEA